MASDSGAQNPAKSIMTFYPTKEEFTNFSRYIAYIESQGAHRAGLAKIVPPEGWKPRRSYDDIDELVIPAPIQQVVTGQSGLFTQYNIQKKPMTVREFRKTANSDKFCSPRYTDFEELERKYWKNITFNAPIYGADVNGTLYDSDVSEWNIGRLDTVLDTVERDSGIVIEGVNTPYLYFGMWKTTFAWHTEDMDLYSINYLHFGEPKSWYCVPPEHGKRLERLAKGFFSGSSQNCEAFLRHKMTLISPSILKKYGIPFEKITQEAGQFMVTFPYGYHAGFNHGFNCAESTNFATERWVEYGKQATLCSCRKDAVKISMDVFVQKYQPERYKLWKAGKDNASIDHTKPTPEAAEFLGCGSAARHGKDRYEDTVSAEGEKRSLSKQRIGTKRHRVCLELPQEVLCKEEDLEREEEGEEQQTAVGKKARLTPKSSGRGAVVNDVPVPAEPKLEDAVKKLSSMEIYPQRAAAAPPTSRCIITLKPSPRPQPPPLYSCTDPLPPPKPGVASLLFHRTLSPTDALRVHSYAKEHYVAPGPQLEWRKPGPPPPAAPANGKGADVEQVCQNMKSKRLPLSKLPCLHPLINDCLSDEELPEPAPKEEDEYEDEDEDEVDVEDGDEYEDEEEEEQEEEEEEEEEEEKVEEEKEKKVGEEQEEEEEEEEEEGEQEAIQESIQESESWAKPLAQLWQSRPHNLKAEKDYNHRMGLQAPYCAVCMLFQTYWQSEYGGSSQRPPVAQGNGMKTTPLIPEMCFTTTNTSDVHFSSPYLEEDGSSQLISCSQCSVRVHTSCYGVPPERVSPDWKCARCEANAMTKDCCLCSLRGGALHRANNNKWVHVLCAVAVLEARFVNLAARSPVDLSDIPLQRFKLKCYYCKKRLRQASGCCIQCSHGRCPTSFHATCALAAGVLMQPDDWPFIVYVTCWKHSTPTSTVRSKASMRELEVGQKVICKHKNLRYYQCEVVALTKATFYEVIFDDGSFSDNLFPEDIENRDCQLLGPPPEGAVVRVRWTDGLIYGGKFVAAHIIPMYQVEFEDASQLSAKRDDVYTLDEELPKRVKTRMSVASDMRFDGIFAEKEVKKNSKRQRVINSRYREDYIEPVIYRAIME